MTTKELTQRDFDAGSIERYLTREIKGTDERITSVVRLENDGNEAMEYQIVGESEGVQLNIFIHYSSEKDEFTICTALRNDADRHSQDGIAQFMGWWEKLRDDMEDGLLVEIGKNEDNLLLLFYQDEATAYYVEIIGDLVNEILDIAPRCARKLKEIFGENPK